jgi:molybdenum cofactor cytidylyltransferase
MKGDVVGVVLAAGESERMGGVAKQLLRFGAHTMAATVVAHAEASHLDRVVVVTGRDADAVTGSLQPHRATIVHNPDYREGNVSSLECGLANAGDAAAVMVLLADMPGVDRRIIDAMIEEWRRSTPWAAVAVYRDGVPNHPFLLSADAIAAMRQIPGRKVLWRLLVDDAPQPVVEVPVARDAPIDVDTPDDYVAALRQMGLGSASDEIRRT